MSNYQRLYEQGGCYFFTVVTQKRSPWLTEEIARKALHQAIIKTRRTHPFEIIAWVLMPDHLHCMWQLPRGDDDFSTRWRMIKSHTSIQLKNNDFQPRELTDSQIKHQELGLWQRRFWEHKIRDEQDFYHHLDYVHINPLKHGLVDHLKDWQYSSFHRYVKQGDYSEDWACDIDLIEGNE